MPLKTNKIKKRRVTTLSLPIKHYPLYPSVCPNVTIYILCYSENILNTAQEYYKIYHWAKPILIKYQNATFENAFWQQLLDIHEEWKDCEMVGTLAYSANTKIDIGRVHNIIVNRLYVNKAYWHFKTTNKKIEGNWMDKIHPKFMELWNDMLHELSLETTVDNHCNYWMCTPELMLKFIDWVTTQFIPIIMGHPLAMIDSKYPGSVPREQRIKRWGLNYYPLLPFVMERMNKCFFDKELQNNII